MSETYISAELRRLVVSRARRRCEYCLVFEDDTYLGFQIDHIISEKHGGLTVDDNLALACLFCNITKAATLALWTPGSSPVCSIPDQTAGMGAHGIEIT